MPARLPALLVVLLLLLLAGGAAACSQPTDAQPFAGQCTPFEVVTFRPADDARDVPTNTPIDLIFSDYPDPDSVGKPGLLLTTGVYWHVGTYSVDLISKRVRFQTAGALRPFLSYTVNVSSAIRSLQGCATTNQQRSFETGAGIAGGSGSDTTPPTALAAVLPLFARSCGGSGCHRQSADDGGGCLENPAAGLSLCDADAFGALVGVPSREVGSLLRVQPDDSSRSFLLRKLLPASTGEGAAAPPIPTTPGHRDPPGEVLPPEDLRLVANWIDSGANP
ncbi:MAG TPA: Ig-like domain-containing protein [Polyangia bacterium]|nr:Ig-like domain-containing protein [Polyangia bacterium]